MSSESTGQVAASVRDKLLQLARSRGEPFDLLLNRFAAERFLYRLSVSGRQDQFILKGAVLLHVWGDGSFRSTRDIDFLARGAVTQDAIEVILRQICSTTVDEDGMEFNLSNLRIEEIREHSDYGGFRAKFTATLGTARIPMQLDFGVGDAVTPAPVEVLPKSILDLPVGLLLGYPPETVIAEKLETIVNFGMGNSRMKDYYDLWRLVSSNESEHSQLALAIRRTFERRSRQIPTDIPAGLTDSFWSSPDKQSHWKAFELRTALDHVEFEEVVITIRDFAMPLFRTASEL